MQNILKYFIISLFCFSSIYTANAQVNKQKTDTVIKAAFRGLRLDIDVVPIASGFIYKGERFGYEAGVYADLKHKYFPAVEIGFAGADKTSKDGMNFKTSGIYSRVGVDFNLIKPKKDQLPTNNMFFSGARLGFSPFSYNYKNVIVENEYWGSAITQNIEGVNTTKVWFEVVAGIRVEVLKNIYMGWTVRNKKLFGKDIPGELSPWYIPGFGVKGEGSSWGVNYAIGYRF
jgi:hypothetical protein